MQQTIGQRLKAAREKAGLSLLDAAHETCIPTGRLQMLEADNFAAFGSMAYARSFLKNYSSFLGVDASEELELFPSPVFGGPDDYRYLTQTHGQWIRRRLRPQTPVPLASNRHSPILGMVGIVSVLIIVSALVGSQLLGWQKPANLEQEKTESSEQALETPTMSPEPTATPEAAADELPDLGLETIVRPAVIPSSIPAPDTPDTPVRRAEIIE